MRASEDVRIKKLIYINKELCNINDTLKKYDVTCLLKRAEYRAAFGNDNLPDLQNSENFLIKYLVLYLGALLKSDNLNEENKFQIANSIYCRLAKSETMESNYFKDCAEADQLIEHAIVSHADIQNKYNRLISKAKEVYDVNDADEAWMLSIISAVTRVWLFDRGISKEDISKLKKIYEESMYQTDFDFFMQFNNIESETPEMMKKQRKNQIKKFHQHDYE